MIYALTKFQIMKKIFKMLIFLTTVIFFSCKNEIKNNNKPVKKTYYSLKLDTTYKINSMEVDYVQRNFFHIGSERSDKEMIVSNKVGTNNFKILVVENVYDSLIKARVTKSFGIATFKNNQQFEKFLEDINVIIDNPNKNLNYQINYNNLNQGAMFYSVDKVLFILKGYQEKTGLIDLTKEDIDSLVSCYNKYKLEKVETTSGNSNYVKLKLESQQFGK